MEKMKKSELYHKLKQYKLDRQLKGSISYLSKNEMYKLLLKLEDTNDVVDIRTDTVAKEVPDKKKNELENIIDKLRTLGFDIKEPVLEEETEKKPEETEKESEEQIEKEPEEQIEKEPEQKGTGEKPKRRRGRPKKNV